MLRRFVTEMDERTQIENDIIRELGGKVGTLIKQIADLKREEKRAEILGETYDPSERIRLEHTLTEAQEKYDRVSSKIQIDRTLRKEEEDRKKREELEAKIAKEKTEIEERRLREEAEAVRRAIEYERFLEEQEKTFYLVFKTNDINSAAKDSYGPTVEQIAKFTDRYLEETGVNTVCPCCYDKLKYRLEFNSLKSYKTYQSPGFVLSKDIIRDLTCENCRLIYNFDTHEYKRWKDDMRYLSKYDPADPDGSVTKTKIHSLRMEFMELERRMAECRAEMCKLDGTYNAQM